MSRKNKRNKKPAARTNQTAVASDSAAQSATLNANKGNKTAKKSSAKPGGGLLKRRNMLKVLIGLPVAGAAGAAIHRYDVQNRGLHDLSMIGQGQPVVVQIHDPACQLCRRLMNNTREALEGNDDVLFKVADVTSSDGEAFRREHNGETVSLVLFDARGRKRGTVNGVQSAEDLKERFFKL